MCPVTSAAKADRLFRTMASSKAVYDELLSYLKSQHAEEVEILHARAVAALARPDLAPTAQIQHGRALMLEDLINQVERYKT